MPQLDDMVPPRLAKYRLYTIKEVAAHIHKTPKHLWKCIQSANNEKKRIGYRIGKRALERLPVRGWSLIGGEWMIKEEDLFKQLGH